MSFVSDLRRGGQLGRLTGDASEVIFCPTASGKKWLMYLSNSHVPILVKPSAMNVILKLHPNARQVDAPPEG